MSDTERPIPIEELLAHPGWLLALARRLVGEGPADDLVQDTWVAALPRPPADRRGVRGWLATVLRNLVRQRHRRGDVRSRAFRGALRDVPRGAAATDDLVAGVERERELARAVVALPEPFRTAVLLRYYRGHSAAGIARSLGLPATTVRSRLDRGLELLLNRLDADPRGGGRAFVLAFLSGRRAGRTTGVIAMGTKAKLAAGAAALLLLGTGAVFLVLSDGGKGVAPKRHPSAARPVSSIGPGEAASPAAETAAEPAASAEVANGARPAEDAAVDQRLARKIDVHFSDMPLRDAVAYLSDRAGLPIRIDDSVDRARSRDELEVNLSAEGVSIRNLLALLTLTHGLTWEIEKGGAIAITAPTSEGAAPRKPSLRHSGTAPVPPSPPPPDRFEIERAPADLALPRDRCPDRTAVVTVTGEGFRYLTAPGGGRAVPVASDLDLYLILVSAANAEGREVPGSPVTRMPLLLDADLRSPWPEVGATLAVLATRGVAVRRLFLGADRGEGSPGVLPLPLPDGSRRVEALGGDLFTRSIHGARKEPPDPYQWFCRLWKRGGPRTVTVGPGPSLGRLVEAVNEARRFGFAVTLREISASDAARTDLTWVGIPSLGELPNVEWPEKAPGRTWAEDAPPPAVPGNLGCFVTGAPGRGAFDFRAARVNLRSEGGGQDTEDAVAAALAALARHQAEDGSFGSTEETGLALLAFLGAGETSSSGRYSGAVAAAVSFLVRQRDRGPRATLALLETEALTTDPPARDAVLFDRDRILASWPPNDEELAIRQVLCLFTGARPEFLPDDGFRRRVRAWLESRTDPDTGRFAGDDEAPRRTAAAAWLRLWLGERPVEGSVLLRGIDLCLDAPTAAWRAPVLAQYARLAAFQAGGERWGRARSRLLDEIRRPMLPSPDIEAAAQRALAAELFCRYRRIGRLFR